MPTRTSNSIQPNGVLDSPTNKKKTKKKNSLATTTMTQELMSPVYR